jgi:hypothetical protein
VRQEARCIFYHQGNIQAWTHRRRMPMQRDTGSHYFKKVHFFELLFRSGFHLRPISFFPRQKTVMSHLFSVIHHGFVVHRMPVNIPARSNFTFP